MPDENTPGGSATTTETPTVKTFTQAELDHQISERLKREREKYADYDALKTAADKLKALEDSQKSDAQKLADRIGEIEKQLGLKDQTIAELSGKLKGATLGQKVAAIANALGALDAADANILAATSGIDPEGETADEAIKKAIEALKGKKPYLFGGTRVASFNPANTDGVALTDKQRIERLNQRMGVNSTPFG
jgi:predicted Zn-dependent peptidase